MTRWIRVKKGIKRHQWVRNNRRGKRRKGIMWDYNLDGMCIREKIKGHWKKYWCRYWRRFNKKELRKENYK